MTWKKLLPWHWLLIVGSGLAFAAHAQDTNPPVLVSSLPANGEQNVARDTAISFTFNEPMRTNHLVGWFQQMPNHVALWSQDMRTITFLFSEALATNRVINYRVSPCGGGPSFMDLAGNWLQPCAYLGSFTTGTNLAALLAEPKGMNQLQQFQLRVLGTANRPLTVDASTNLIDWLPIETNWLSHDPYEFSDPRSPEVPFRFYRATLISASQ